MSEMKLGTFGSLEEAREFFRQDRFATDAGMVIEEMSPGRAVCSFIIDERHRNAQGGVMGGATFTLIDFAYAVAASSMHRPTVAMQSSVSYLNAAREGKLTATAECLKNGRTSCVYNVDVRDEDGRSIAQGVMTGFKLEGGR